MSGSSEAPGVRHDIGRRAQGGEGRLVGRRGTPKVRPPAGGGVELDLGAGSGLVDVAMARVRPFTCPAVLRSAVLGGAALGSLALLAGCTANTRPSCDFREPAPLSVQVVDHGWHTDLALPADGLTGGLAAFRHEFPGMRVLLVGFGKRTFMTSPARGLGDYLVGPLPGDAALLVAGLSAAPARAYRDGGTIATIPLTPAQRDRLDRFVWDTFEHDARGRALAIGSAFFAGGVFFAARPGYSGLHTCNTWTAEALRAAGLRASPFLVVFSGQAMVQAARLGGMCRISGQGSALDPPGS